MAGPDFSRNVFVNCPFDWEYEPILKAILFCIARFGLRPRIATERNNAGETRIDKIAELIRASEYSIHDLSRCQARGGRRALPDEHALRTGDGLRLPPLWGRTVRPQEDPGAGGQRYRYQAALSDLAGIDIEPHEGRHDLAVRKVRNWFAGMAGFDKTGASQILSEYEDFQEWYAETQRAAGFSVDDMRDVPVAEFLRAILDWTAAGRPRL